MEDGLVTTSLDTTMKKLLGITIISALLFGCNKSQNRLPTDNSYSQQQYKDSCREKGLYKEIDSNECEELLDALDLDDVFKKKKKIKQKELTQSGGKSNITPKQKQTVRIAVNKSKPKPIPKKTAKKSSVKQKPNFKTVKKK